MPAYFLLHVGRMGLEFAVATGSTLISKESSTSSFQQLIAARIPACPYLLVYSYLIERRGEIWIAILKRTSSICKIANKCSIWAPERTGVDVFLNRTQITPPLPHS
jgi:hypothetical protein